MEPELQEWVKRNSVPVKRESNFTIHELRTTTRLEDTTNRVRVLAVGPENDLEVKKVLLLGETGNGKTFFCNAFVNRLFGVGIEDSIRLQLKDQMDGAAKSSIRSQTEYTTAYVIYHQNGMPHRYNYMIVDTAGFGDTGGREQEEVNERNLRRCLANQTWIRGLNSVGIVWKGSEHRLDERKREILGRMKDLLGFDTKPITDILVTFSKSERSDALDVMRSAGVSYAGEFLFDNIPLYKSCPQNRLQKSKLEMEWEVMEESHNAFLEAVNRRRSVDLEVTVRLIRSRLELEGAGAEVEALCQQEDEFRKTLQAHERKLSELRGRETEVDMDEMRALENSSEELVLENGQHCHFCTLCHKVCVPSCSTDRTLGEMICPVNGDSPHTCSECDHRQLNHEFRGKILLRDATFEQKVEWAKKAQHERAKEWEANIRDDIKVYKAQLKEIETENKRWIKMASRLEERISRLKLGN
ncbi:uncharacterized protein LOC122258617 [Penaeus japonicus]|uniref:uncharacterized protein LOC122258617 n=1 Tax=Penaeus japonicus TaxID=27405 RepID=UPI001C70E067|nr:uncharacterized protein LOC122258617 [Penaeus japonicus]